MDIRQKRFALVTAGHHFLLEVLPFRQPESHSALETFIDAALKTSMPLADLEVVLLRCLNVLSRHTARVPSLVDRYLSSHNPVNCVERFKEIIEQVLQYGGIEDGSVQEAIRIIDARYGSTDCTPRYVTDLLGLRLASMDVRFKRFTSSTLTERIRLVRLTAAAVLLVTCDKAVKEIWVEVGYNDHSNFDHDFKRRFGVTPKAYRGLSLRPAAQDLFRLRPITLVSPRESAHRAQVLIVDDDEGTRTTLSAGLGVQGHSVSSAATGHAALRVLNEHPPTAVLIDYHLADTDGVTLLRTIRQARVAPQAGTALFTADWDLLDRAVEVAELEAVIASKLCDLEQVNDLVTYLSLNGDASAGGWPARVLPC